MSNLKYHFVAFLIVSIWGSTFVFTKMLLQAGLSPAQIFTFHALHHSDKHLAYRLFLSALCDAALCHCLSSFRAHH